MERKQIILYSSLAVFALILIIVVAARSNNKKSVPYSVPYSVPVSNNVIVDSIGTKRALLIGCNYNFPGSTCELYGCIQDVMNIKSFLISLDYVESNIIMMIDDGSTEMPTKNNIKNNLNLQIDATLETDSLFVWYSGHGSQLRNFSSDGGFDECWCPPDTIKTGNYLRDNELLDILKNAKSNSKIFVGSDSCHSATILDLKYIAQQNISTANRSLDDIRGKTSVPDCCFTAPKSNLQLRDRALTNQSFTKGANLTTLADSNYVETAALIVCISGCQDYDTSADAYLNGKAQGAMTWAFKECFMENMTLSDLLVNMRMLLSKNGFLQIPQLTFGKSLNPNTTTLFSLIG